MQSWHRFDLLSYALALRMIAHLMLYGLSCSFNFQTYLLSSVLLRLFECRKVVLWPLNRSLKIFLVRPMYVSFRAIILCCHCRLVYDRFCKALAVERAVCWFFCSYRSFPGFLVLCSLFLFFDNIFYIGHTTVA